MKPTVFIHTSAGQMLAAKVAEYALTRASVNRDNFTVRILKLEDHPELTSRDGQVYLRAGRRVVYRADHSLSYTPLRFLPPQLMGYEGRALVIDPDVFAVTDVCELLTRDMGGKAILCRRVESEARYPYASSVMLLSCSRLRHWRWEEGIAEVFALKRDYRDWVSLRTEPEAAIGPLEEEWNHFDTLNERTKLLHNRQQITQPWKTGLSADKLRFSTPGLGSRLTGFARALLGRKNVPTYRCHPDPRQEQLFFRLLNECLGQGHMTRDFLRDEIAKGHVRPDLFAALEFHSTQARALVEGWSCGETPPH